MPSVPDHIEFEENSPFDENAEQLIPATDTDFALSGPPLVERLREVGLALGFVRVGIARVEAFTEARQAFDQWLSRGFAGTMGYLRDLGDRSDPRRLLPNARTIVVVAMPTTGPIYGEPEPGHGNVADYAMGLDYHIAIRGRLKRLGQAIADYSGQSIWVRPCVDTAPLLEREAARRAGIGFIGKSAMLIVPGIGPRVLLGLLVSSVDLPADAPMTVHCGRCTKCIDACPTSALVEPYVVDARRCVSYLNIEHQGEVPRALRDSMGCNLVGCDVCQSVCPHDRVTASAVMPSDNTPRPRLVHPMLEAWLHMSSNEYRKITKRTALRRLGRVQLMRNAAIALGNAGDPACAVGLSRALSGNSSPIVRAHSAWALGKLGGSVARDALERAWLCEAEPTVRDEIEQALKTVT